MSLGANVRAEGETADSDASRLCAFEPAVRGSGVDRFPETHARMTFTIRDGFTQLWVVICGAADAGAGAWGIQRQVNHAINYNRV